MILETRGLCKAYINGGKSIEVLKGIDLRVEKSQFIAIVGPSGAGKSTLLHLAGGLDAPGAGEVIFDGKPLYKLSDTARSLIRNERIGFVFQFYHLLSEFTVLENVLMPARISGAGRRQAGEKALRLLADVGLGARLDHFPAELSGGEKQRAAIVRALINKPSLLLCDEPTGNLDSKSGADILALLKKINSEDRTAVVLVTHNLELAKSADCVYNLVDGLLVN